jgi:hypothetical protein
LATEAIHYYWVKRLSLISTNTRLALLPDFMKTMSVKYLIIPLITQLSVGCVGGGTPPPPAVPIVNSTPPTVIWEAGIQPQAVVLIEGRAGDSEQPVSTLLVVIESNTSGEVWRGNPRSDGVFIWNQPTLDGTYWLTSGTHQITVSVTDSTNQVVQLTKAVEVQPINNSTGDEDTASDSGDTASSP